MYDHPLDEHYRRMFLEAKAKAGGGTQAKGGAKMPGLLSNKAQDPLIRAEAVRKLDEQRSLYQQEFQLAIEDLERQF